MLQEYADGTGSMAREAEKTANSWEGSLNRVKNTWTDTVENVADSDAIIRLINLFNDLLSTLNNVTEFLESFGTLGAGLGVIVAKSLSSKGLDLASYDEENGFSGLLASIQKLKEVKPVTEEIKNGFTELFSIGASDHLDSWVGKFDKLADSCGVTDKSFTDFLKTTQKSNIVYKTSEDAIAGYQSYLKSTSRDLTLVDLRTKALSTSMKVLSSIGWMALITAVGWIIGKAVKGIGNYVKRVEEARNANEEFANQFNELNSSLKQNKEIGRAHV